MYGFFGKLLVIDLDSNSCKHLPLENDVLRGCLGGRGLAAHLLLSGNPQNVDPLSPDNMLIFATGPVAGSPVWGSCRHGIFTKSPQTGKTISEEQMAQLLQDYYRSRGWNKRGEPCQKKQ